MTKLDPFSPFQESPLSEAKIITITGPSAAGKTALVRALLERRKELQMVVSCTTRARRGTDLPGEYSYLSEEEFRSLKEESAFLWAVHVHGAWYGTLRRSVADALERRFPSLMFLVPECTPLLRSCAKGLAAHVFIPAPPEDVLRERLLRREIRALASAEDWELVRSEVLSAGRDLHAAQLDGILKERSGKVFPMERLEKSLRTVRERIEDCRAWEDEARGGGIPYLVFDNLGPIAECAERFEAELVRRGILS